MHSSPHVVLGCTDCHGGNPAPNLSKEAAHVLPKNKEFWKTAANPPNSNVWLNHESPEFIRFINPGDLRVAKQSCGLCHDNIINNVHHSMMNHGAMLWGAALYNNGGFNLKNYRFGQAYGASGAPLRLVNYTPVSKEDTKERGILPFLDPLPRFNLGNPGNILRIFEKGGEKQLQLGNPTVAEPPGRPLRRLSERGLGTLNRIDPVFLGIQKTRLNDPLLGFLGSNDNPGDYRSSGCTACHVVYANDRSPTNSGWYSKYGHQGLSFTADNTIPKNEKGHPIKHQLTRAIPSSQCMNCHMHQGNLFVNPYLGYTWWDQESDGNLMYPKEQKNPTDAELVKAVQRNPEAGGARGLWGDPEFVARVAELNPRMKHTQFADYHGHGWVFRAVFKKDKKGNLLDLQDKKISHEDPQKFAKAVHLKDIHLARGMQCADCHFDLDVHGNGMLYGEPRNATTINCIDCHGTVDQRPSLITTGTRARSTCSTRATRRGDRGSRGKERSSGSNRPCRQTCAGKCRRRSTRSTRVSALQREVGLRENAAARRQKLGATLATPDERERRFAHDNSKMDCQVCHTSWATSCFGCHLPMKANTATPQNKYEGTTSRNFTTYNPQVVRDDVFMLGIDGTVKKNRMAVIRSSSAVVVSSQNQNREWVYSQAQTVSAEGYSGQAFNPHFPHTTSGVGTTKNCTDCHLSRSNDNNAWMTQLLGFGTGTVNFFGRYAWVAEGKKGFHGVVWTEPEEPQAAIGSYLHKLAYPANYQQHIDNRSELKEAHEHGGADVQDVVLRGEYLYTANGPGGMEVFDVAKHRPEGFLRAHRHRACLATRSAHLRPHAVRHVDRAPEHARARSGTSPPAGERRAADRYVLRLRLRLGSAGRPRCDQRRHAGRRQSENNFLKKDVSFNPGGVLTGATFVATAGHRLYMTTPRGLYVINVSDPMNPRIEGELTNGYLRNPRCVTTQWRYAFVTDDDGMKVLDITNPARPVPVNGALVRLNNAQRLYAARTYAYVANGKEGLAIIDIENPERPRLDQMFNADGAMNDTRAVQIGSINASMFALVADGHNGLRVVQLISPENVPEHMGFSPRPNPKLIATYHTHGDAIAVSRGLDRDRVVDETGGQTVVFGRRGSRPFKLSEMLPFFRKLQNGRHTGPLYRVEDLTYVDGKLATKGGAILTPLPVSAPAPPEEELPTEEPAIEPTPLPIYRPDS
jgi:hypothetical protein